MTSGHSFLRLVPDRVGVLQSGAIMYTLTNIDFSSWSVVSELPSDEETVDANQAIPSDFASASSPAMTVEMAVFGAP